MISRREMVLSGALALMWRDCACAQTSLRGRGPGCTLHPTQATAFLATATEPQAFDGTPGKLIASTGNREFDYALAQMLSRLTDLFGVLPGFCFYDDYDGPNAFATTATRLRRADGTVLYGKRHFLNHMASPEGPEVVVTATCAHEFGHIVQYKYKLTKQLTDGQATAKRAELNADFFAGYFAGARKLQKPDYPAAVFAANRYDRGDFVTDSTHHGTPDERAAAVVRGFEVAYRERRSFTDAIQIGMNYVSGV
jgi:hypothetical protein